MEGPAAADAACARQVWAAEGQEFLVFGEMVRHLGGGGAATGARVALLRELNRQAARMAPSVAIPALIVALRVCPPRMPRACLGQRSFHSCSGKQ